MKTTTAPAVTPVKIELRNIKIYDRLSEETTAFTADLYLDGIKVGQAENSGKGGNTDYNAYKHPELLEKAEAYALSLPPIHYEKTQYMDAWDLPNDLEHFIDNIIDEEFQKKDKAKFLKQMEKNCQKWLCAGVPNSNEYRHWKFKLPISEILARTSLDAKAHTAFATAIKNIQSKLEEGEVILNKNIPQSIFDEAIKL